MRIPELRAPAFLRADSARDHRPIPVYGTRIDNWRRFRADLPGLLLDAMESCGEVVRINVFYNSLVLVNDPEIVRHILIEAPDAFGRGYSHRALRKILGEGMLTADNDAWVPTRRAAAPAFVPRRMDALADVALARLEPWLARWDRAAERGDVRPMAIDLMALTAQIALDHFFSAELSEADALAFVDDFMCVQAHAFRRIGEPWAIWSPAAARAQARIEAIARGLRPTPESASLMPQAMTLLATAPENPSNTLAWTLYLLARHPDVARRAEAAARAGDEAYLGAVIHESIRLYPGAWGFERTALADTTVAGRRFPAGTSIILSGYTLHRDRRHWPEPHAFRPERFLGRSLKDLPALTYLPFSAGPRRCVGDRFTMVVVSKVLPRLLARYRFELDPRERGATWPLFTLRPRTGVLVRLQRIAA